MLSRKNSIEEYIESLPEDRQIVITKLRQIILENLPEGFEEVLSHGMITYVVPHSMYPKGYHVDPDQPLPFLSLASQKNHVALYHFGIYMQPELLKWFTERYREIVSTKLDMGKSCMRFRNPRHIPYSLIAELCRKVTVETYIQHYEANR